MAEVNAVIGYLPDAQAKALASGKQPGGPVELRLESGTETHARIDPKYIAGALLGASKRGETAVQVFLNDKAQVETVSRVSAADLRLRSIKDYVLGYHGPVVVSIFAPPTLINQLLEAQRNELLQK